MPPKKSQRAKAKPAKVIAKRKSKVRARAVVAVGQPSRNFSGKSTEVCDVDYLLFLPKDYRASARKKWPLILFLHGAGERGDDLALVAKHGPPKIATEQPDFPFIIVSPQCPDGLVWDDVPLLALLDHVTGTHRVDARRVYLTGVSMGGFGAWHLAFQHPERFAAVVPICGGDATVRLRLADFSVADCARLPALRSLGIWAFHGGRDDVVPLDESARLVELLRELRVKDLHFTIYPEAGHDAWTETYANPKLYEWLLKHRR